MPVQASNSGGISRVQPKVACGTMARVRPTPGRAATLAEVTTMAKNTGKGHRKGAVKGRSDFQHQRTVQWFKRDSESGRILNGSRNQHKGVRNEK